METLLNLEVVFTNTKKSLLQLKQKLSAGPLFSFSQNYVNYLVVLEYVFEDKMRRTDLKKGLRGIQQLYMGTEICHFLTHTPPAPCADRF